MRKLIYRTFVITILTIFLTHSLVFQQTFAGEKYFHKDFLFEVDDDWAKAADIEGIEVIFMKDVDSEVMPIMMVAMNDEIGGLTTEDFVNNTSKEIIMRFPQAKFLFERDVHTGNVKWRELVYQYSDGGFSFQVIQYHTINGNKHYAFTGQCLKSDFKEHLHDFRKSFDTWEFRNN